MKKMILFVGCITASVHGMSNHEEKHLVKLFKICSEKRLAPSIMTTDKSAYSLRKTRKMQYAESDPKHAAICAEVYNKIQNFVIGMGQKKESLTEYDDE